MKCPGQDSRYWKPGDIFEAKCPECGQATEFFKDDTARRCKHCGHRFVNPKMDFGCASYCQYAEQCLGDLPPELLAQRQDLLKDRVAVEMKRHFGTDFRRIGHAGRVARYAERIGKETGGDLSVILTAAYLHDIGIPEAEQTHPTGSQVDHEAIGERAARGLLKKLGAPPDLIEEVVGMIGRHHHPGENETDSFKALYDADRIANLEEALKAGQGQGDEPKSREEIEAMIGRAGFLTGAGRKAALDVLGGS